MPKISVIIPVYNAKDYLARCLDSVCNQTLKDIEIICVNDASTDNSIDILNQYAKKYLNLKVIDCLKNGGESVARNIGLDNATGEYIGFVDNDDKIDLDFYEKLYSKAIETNADIIKGEALIYSYEGQKIIDMQNIKIRKNNSKLFFLYHWWTAIYKNQLIKSNGIRFLENYALGGDVLFLNQALIFAKELALVDNSYYHYYRREFSGDSKILSTEKIKSVFDIHRMIVDNTNRYANELDKKGILNIYEWCISVCIEYAYRRRTIENLEFCAESALSMYRNCLYYKDELDNLLAERYLKESHFLRDGNKNELINYLKRYDSPQKRYISTLRLKTKRKGFECPNSPS